MADDIHYNVMRLIEAQPEISQRELARELGVSLGKTNYCLKALIDKGWVKANNFKNSNNKMAYVYKLTPNGIDEKARITIRFLKRKMEEYEDLKEEIEMLQDEVNNNGRM